MLSLFTLIALAQTSALDPSLLMAGQLEPGAPVDAAIVFRARPSVEALERSGCAVERLPSGTPVQIGRVVSARCGWDAIARVARLDGVERIAARTGLRPPPPVVLPPLAGPKETEVLPLRRSTAQAVTGKGVVVADIDYGVNVFHPALFHASDSTFAWLDVNASGAFETGVDAVDFNGNGAADPGEVLRVLKATVSEDDRTTGVARTFNTEPALVPAQDWLFQDENGNGVRDFGPQAPYGDARVNFGEQLYLADDVNQNGRLEPAEKVIALGGSKIKAVLYRDQRTPNAPLLTFTRGTNLAQVPADPQLNHASMVLGTIGGGSAIGNRWAGIAPDAELLLTSTDLRTDALASLAWVLEQKADIVLWEGAKWYWEPLDGSSPLEVACDAAHDQGVLQLATAGNLGKSAKHRAVTVPSGPSQARILVPGGTTSGVLGNFNWRSTPGDLFFSVTLGATPVAMPGASGNQTVGSVKVAWARGVSSRGTAVFSFSVRAVSGVLPGGPLVFDVENAGAPALVHGYVTDTASGWIGGATWADGVASSGTMGTPATSDRTLAVGAYVFDFPFAGHGPGALDEMSSRGPRIDGLDTIDLAAPEDHVSPDYLGRSPGGMVVGSGTSNATPLVAGIAALLKQVHPQWRAAELAAALRSGAAADGQTGSVPNDGWGGGKVRAFRSAYARAAVDSLPPVAVGTARRVRGSSETTLDASASTDPEGEALHVTWDVGYSGRFTAEGRIAVVAASPRWVKLRVEDPAGNRSEAVIEVTEVEPPPAVADAGVAPVADAGTAVLPPLPPLPPVPPDAPAPRGLGCSAGEGSWPLGLLALVVLSGLRRKLKLHVGVGRGV